ncbi:MAG TPA: beta-ketoacyl-[acyl-carrier-protein] synthase family protein [Burkholderiaceae bacterium]|nr:beta-ketoacyl-[acyl-carrier-protein] synthase family protein [Burkholderiaceae bacterium]
MDRDKPARGGIAVTGIGQIAPHGDDPGAAFEAMLRGEAAVTRWSEGDAEPTAVAAASFRAADYFTKLQLSGMDRVSQIAVAAALRAWRDAGLDPATTRAAPGPERIGVFVGCGMGGAAAIENAFVSFNSVARVPPLTVPAFMPNAPAAHVAMRLQARGPVLTYSVACASSAVAIAEAARAIACGDVDVALAGGAEAVLVPSAIRAWQALQTLATPDPERIETSCRPFARDRSGFVLGEGSAFLVMEPSQHAEQRNARAYGRFAGAATVCDATHLTKPDVDGQRRALAGALRSAGISPADVGYCNAHGTATKLGDVVECSALRDVWGDDIGRLKVSSTKSMHGHLLGAAGALEALVTLQALNRRQLPPNANCRAPDPACDVPLVLEAEEAPALRYAISSSFAFGGTNVVLVFARD